MINLDNLPDEDTFVHTQIYHKMVEAGVLIDHHDIDLFVPVTPQTTAILADYKYRSNVTTFDSQIEPYGRWYDIPFAYLPAWPNFHG